MPPKGGYESIKYKRNLPIRGPAGWVVFAGVGAVCAFGFYKVGAGNNERKWVLSACCVVSLWRESWLEEWEDAGGRSWDWEGRWALRLELVQDILGMERQYDRVASSCSECSRPISEGPSSHIVDGDTWVHSALPTRRRLPQTMPASSELCTSTLTVHFAFQQSCHFLPYSTSRSRTQPAAQHRP
jgi:hypothetical protein